MSHTTLVILGGIAALGILLVLGYLTRHRAGMRSAALIFIPCWLLVAVINMAVGAIKAGYPVREELPILLLVFGIPAAAAFTVSRVLKKH